jgi:nucleoside-diphosphate-sugar epimerase
MRSVTYERIHWHAIDLAAPNAVALLEPVMRSTDVVIHLALSVQPVRDHDYLYRANVLGSRAVFDAMVAAGVGQLVYASSLSAYAPGQGEPVTEAWPVVGQHTSTYSRHKVIVERMLDQLIVDHPEMVVARFRPTVVVQREAATLFRSLYLGSVVPRAALKLLRAAGLPILPMPDDMRLQCVHADDVGDAVVSLMLSRAQGAFNVAADVLDSSGIAGLLKARPLLVKPDAMRRAILLLSRLRLVAVTPGWYDVATKSPFMDTTKAHRELGWTPKWSSTASALELIDGLADGVVGRTAATGLTERRKMETNRITRQVHDSTLVLWGALAVARAAGLGRAGAPDAAVIAGNLIAGTPMAIDRVRARRRDAVALLAPVTVGAALLAYVRGGWTPVAAVATLGALAAADRRRVEATAR